MKTEEIDLTRQWKSPYTANDTMESWKRRQEEISRRKYQQTKNGCYWPFGRAGGGAPNSSNYRKLNVRKKHKEPEETCKNEIRTLPSIRKRETRFWRGAEEELRYQFHPDVRKSVDLHWRYLTPPQDKVAYRLMLDRLLHEKRAIAEREMRRNHENQNVNLEPPWGRVGPGGQQWRTPRQVGLNFLHSLGWTGEKAFRRLEDQIDNRPEHLMIASRPHNHKPTDHKTPEEELTGGVELVPLLARRRSFKKSAHLPTCDVTNRPAFDRPPEWKEPGTSQDYLRELNSQVTNKQMQIKAEKEEEKRESSKHFETWGRFWGRPGHGAPRQIKVKENLNNLLYPPSLF